MRPDTYSGCTPGFLNPAVTQATIRTTICEPGWAAGQERVLTANVRTALTNRLVREYMRYLGPSLSSYQLVYLIPVSLGGQADGDVRNHPNMWVLPASERRKAEVDGAANQAVCQGLMSLKEAQDAEVANWLDLGRKLHVQGLG